MYGSLLNCVPYVLTCQCALHTYVLMCQHPLRAYVLMCQRVLLAYMLTCQCALRAYMLMYFVCLLVNVPCVLMCLHADVLTCKHASSSFSHLPAFLTWLVSSFDVTFFSFFAIVFEVVHSDGKVWQFNEYFINQSLLSLCTPKYRECSWDAR